VGLVRGLLLKKLGKEVRDMPWGFGRGGWWGWGRGNPYPFCRWFPWLPRWWWATPYAPYYASTIPYYGAYPYYGYYGAYPYYGYGPYFPPIGYPTSPPSK